MNLLNRAPQPFTEAKAKEVAAIAAILNADVTYKVVVNPNPDGPDTAIIEVYDEEDVKIALV